MKTKSFLFLLLTSTFLKNTIAQEIVRSTIGSLSSTMTDEKFLIQQTTGQPSATISVKNEKGLLLKQGFNQPIFTVSNTNPLNAFIFPNPNSGSFQFQVDLLPHEPYNYLINDLQGKTISIGEGKGNFLQSITFAKPTSGMYLLHILSSNQSSSFRINIIH